MLIVAVMDGVNRMAAGTGREHIERPYAMPQGQANVGEPIGCGTHDLYRP
jgi:hypothetical protein